MEVSENTTNLSVGQALSATYVLANTILSLERSVLHMCQEWGWTVGMSRLI